MSPRNFKKFLWSEWVLIPNFTSKISQLINTLHCSGPLDFIFLFAKINCVPILGLDSIWWFYVVVLI